MKRSIALGALLLSSLSGCATAQSSVQSCSSWSDLFDSPKEHNGKEVVLYGWFSAEFEVCALNSPDGKHELWIVPSDSEPTLCTLEQAVSRPVHQWAEVRGVFNHGASYGHLGTYSAAMANAKIVFVSSKTGSACAKDGDKPAR